MTTNSAPAQFPEHIFKAYDIRGLVDGELSSELAYRVGRAFVAFLRSQEEIFDKKIVVGRDMRPTSLEFQKEVIRGITDEGVDVVDVGLVSTPVFNFACAHYSAHAGGIIVTASHNPAEYNGFKLTRSNGMGVGKGSGMEIIREAVRSGVNFAVDNKITGSVSKMDVLPDYFKRIFSFVTKQSINPLKIVIDFGNGMGSYSIKKMLSELPIQASFLYDIPDGSFPNHEANPLKVETLRELQKKVVETGSDFGFAFDGDADRIGLVDETGQVVDPSFVGTLVGLEVLRNNPGANMLYDLRQSMVVPEVWQAAGAGRVEKVAVGHANIKREMKKDGAYAFASELSLHLYFHDMYDLEASDLSLLYIMRALSREKKPLSEIILPFKKYAHSGEINFEVADKNAAMNRIEDAYKKDAIEISHLDGIWMGFDWGWLNARPSNTEPLLRLNLETRTREMTEEKVEEVKKIITA